MLSHLIRASVASLTLAVFTTASVLASDGTLQHDPIVPVPETVPCLVDPGFIAVIEDRSNDTGFAVIAEDQTNDTGFLVGTPINDACDDTPSVSPDDPEGSGMLVEADDEQRDRIESP